MPPKPNWQPLITACPAGVLATNQLNLPEAAAAAQAEYLGRINRPTPLCAASARRTTVSSSCHTGTTPLYRRPGCVGAQYPGPRQRAGSAGSSRHGHRFGRSGWGGGRQIQVDVQVPQAPCCRLHKLPHAGTPIQLLHACVLLNVFYQTECSDGWEIAYNLGSGLSRACICRVHDAQAALGLSRCLTQPQFLCRLCVLAIYAGHSPTRETRCLASLKCMTA